MPSTSHDGFGQKIIDQNGRVGQDHALDGGVRDIALMPQGDVFHGGVEVSAHDAGEPADLLGGHRIALVRHRGRAFLTGAEGLLGFANFGALQVADFESDLFERARRSGRAPKSRRRDDRERSPAKRWRAGFRPRRAQIFSSASGPMWPKVPTAPEILPTRRSSAAASRRTMSRRISSYHRASFRPKVIGSAWMPWVRPICGVCLNS